MPAMRRALFAILLIALALPAAGQPVECQPPHPDLGVALYCDFRCEQTVARQNNVISRGVFNPMIHLPASGDFRAAWRERYGVDLGDGLSGGHSPYRDRVSQIAQHPTDPFKLGANRAGAGSSLDDGSAINLLATRGGGQNSCAIAVVTRFASLLPGGGVVDEGCPLEWSCPPALPEPIRAGCASGVIFCEITVPPAGTSEVACYREHPRKIAGKGYVMVAKRCDWKLLPEPPVVPPEPPVDPPVEPPVEPTVEPPGPPAAEGCGEALDAYAATRAAEAEAWARVETECRP